MTDEPVEFERQIKSKVQLRKKVETHREPDCQPSQMRKEIETSQEKYEYPTLPEDDRININNAISKACSKSPKTGKNQTGIPRSFLFGKIDLIFYANEYHIVIALRP